MDEATTTKKTVEETPCTFCGGKLTIVEQKVKPFRFECHCENCEYVGEGKNPYWAHTGYVNGTIRHNHAKLFPVIQANLRRYEEELAYKKENPHLFE